MSVFKNIARGVTPPYVWCLMKKCFKWKPDPPDPPTWEEQLKGSYMCPVCGKSVRFFNHLPYFYLKFNEMYPRVQSKNFSETMNSHAYTCPHCGATDRDRLYAMFLEQRFAELEKTQRQYRFLDVAPSKPLQNFIQRHVFIQYRSADLYMDDVDDKVDIMNMDIYQDGQFDAILCSHVLEHVEDDRKAMAELYRVLDSDGFAIVVVPIDLMLETDFEDKNIVSEADRWRYFGQNDHVRAYSKRGFIAKLEETGFVVHQYDEKYFGAWEFRNKGVEPHSVLYVVTK